jgi:hypothetical protein
MASIAFSSEATTGSASSRQAHTSIAISVSVAAKMTPADQARDWNRRWIEVRRRLDELNLPHSGSMGAESIHAARDGLHAFYIQCYHLKDHIIQQTSVGKGVVETAITQDPTLSLIADLANLDKHGRLTQPPRSGEVPRFGAASGNADEKVGPGWRLDLPILHRGKPRDGMTVAAEAVDAWQRLLTAWKLI